MIVNMWVYQCQSTEQVYIWWIMMQNVPSLCRFYCIFYLRMLLFQVFITLHAKLSGAVYCNWSCLCVRLFVCGSVTTITRNYVHHSSSNWVCRWRYHLQLIKLWPSRASGKGVCSGAKFFGSTLLQLACSVCVSLSAFFIAFISYDISFIWFEPWNICKGCWTSILSYCLIRFGINLYIPIVNPQRAGRRSLSIWLP